MPRNKQRQRQTLQQIQMSPCVSVQSCSTDKLHCRKRSKEEHCWNTQCIHSQCPNRKNGVAAIFPFERCQRAIDPFFTILNRRHSSKLFSPDKNFPSCQPERGADNRESYWGNNQQDLVIEHNGNVISFTLEGCFPLQVMIDAQFSPQCCTCTD